MSEDAWQREAERGAQIKAELRAALDELPGGRCGTVAGRLARIEAAARAVVAIHDRYEGPAWPTIEALSEALKGGET